MNQHDKTKTKKKVKNAKNTRNKYLNLSRSINKKCQKDNFTYKSSSNPNPN